MAKSEQNLDIRYKNCRDALCFDYQLSNRGDETFVKYQNNWKLHTQSNIRGLYRHLTVMHAHA